ncbi:MAG: hypothetical protein M3439_09380 [Chloroflexota bacterium]|nr:hypothetical protein [Chloroflexota bacterium]
MQALDWLNAAGNPSLALISIPIDPDVVLSLGQDESREAALTAIDTLQQAAAGSPLAICLRRPAEITDGLGLAQSAVSSITSRYPGQALYVSACEPDERPGWQQDIAEAVRPDAEEALPNNALVPLSGGALLFLEQLDGTGQLDAEHFRLRARGNYAVYALDTPDPLGSDLVADAAEALADTSHSALILVTPTTSVDPAGLASSIGSVVLAGDALPEGFSGINAPALRVNDDWQRSNVGTTGYLRATTPTAAIAAGFVGTDIYLAAIESPDSGLVQIWIDPESPTSLPTVVLDLASSQARDAAIPVARGLPAARHEIVLQAIMDDGDSVTISGLFVTGKPATVWTGTMAAAVVLLAAVAALSERCYTAIVAIRRRTGPPRRRARPGHPRVFARDR